MRYREEELRIKRIQHKKHNNIFSLKEVFERVGYGFVTPQFINILFFHTGAGLFLIGLMYGIKNLLSALISSITNLYSRHHKIDIKWISIGGIVFGFSFLFMALARVIRSTTMFAIALLVGAIGIVTYGDIYKKIYDSVLSYEKRNKFLKRIAYYGVIISAVAMLISGYIIDALPGRETGTGMKIYGYLISFEITAFCFIIAEFLLSRIQDRRPHLRMSFYEFMKTEFRFYLKKTHFFLKDIRIFLLLVATTLTATLQIIGNAYYGIYIFNLFDGFLFGRYLNVAVIYAIATVIGIVGYLFTKSIHNTTGIVSHLLLSALLMTILPFILVFNPHFLSITAAVSAMFFGGVVFGSAHNFLVKKIIHERSRGLFYNTHAIFSFIPSLILIIGGSWIATTLGMKTLFITIGASFIFILTPLYLILVIISEKKI